MTIELHDEQRFDVPAPALLETWKDPAFQRARSQHLGTLDVRCHVQRDGDIELVVLEETRDTGWKPHVYVTRLSTRWRGSVGDWQLERLAGPGDAAASGTVTIQPDGAGSRLVLRGTLEVRVPMLGGLIERGARRALIAERSREARFVAGWFSKIPGT